MWVMLQWTEGKHDVVNKEDYHPPTVKSAHLSHMISQIPLIGCRNHLLMHVSITLLSIQTANWGELFWKIKLLFVFCTVNLTDSLVSFLQKWAADFVFMKTLRYLTMWGWNYNCQGAFWWQTSNHWPWDSSNCTTDNKLRLKIILKIVYHVQQFKSTHSGWILDEFSNYGALFCSQLKRFELTTTPSAVFP